MLMASPGKVIHQSTHTDLLYVLSVCYIFSEAGSDHDHHRFDSGGPNADSSAFAEYQDKVK